MVSLPGFMRVEKLAEAINRENISCCAKNRKRILTKKPGALMIFLKNGQARSKALILMPPNLSICGRSTNETTGIAHKQGLMRGYTIRILAYVQSL